MQKKRMTEKCPTCGSPAYLPDTRGADLESLARVQEWADATRKILAPRWYVRLRGWLGI